MSSSQARFRVLLGTVVVALALALPGAVALGTEGSSMGGSMQEAPAKDSGMDADPAEDPGMKDEPSEDEEAHEASPEGKQAWGALGGFLLLNAAVIVAAAISKRSTARAKALAGEDSR